MRRYFIYKKSIILLFFLAIFLGSILSVFFFNQQNFKIQNVSYSDSKRLIDKKEDIYIIYGSRYCIYCNNMQDTYKNIVKKEKIKNVYQVDLSNEKDEVQQNLENEGIDAIPSLTYFHNGKKVSTLTGEKGEKIVKEFFEKSKEKA